MKKYRLTRLGKYVVCLFIAFIAALILILYSISSYYRNELQKLKSLDDVKPAVITEDPKSSVKPTLPVPDPSVNADNNKAFAKLLKVSVFFEPDKADICMQYLNSLDVFSQAAKTLGDFNIIIEGNCATLVDGPLNKDNMEYNNKLSLQRAQAVAQYLKQSGIPQELIKVVANGSQKPLKDNKTPEGRVFNRRSDVYFEQK